MATLPYFQLSMPDTRSGPVDALLAADITDTATSLTLSTGDGANLSASDFCVYVDAEEIYCGSRSGDTCSSLARGFNGTTASAHTLGAPVRAWPVRSVVQRLYDNMVEHRHSPVIGDQASGAFTIATGQFGIHGKRLILTGSQRATLQGTGQLVIVGCGRR